MCNILISIIKAIVYLHGRRRVVQSGAARRTARKGSRDMADVCVKYFIAAININHIKTDKQFCVGTRVIAYDFHKTIVKKYI